MVSAPFFLLFHVKFLVYKCIRLIIFSWNYQKKTLNYTKVIFSITFPTS